MRKFILQIHWWIWWIGIFFIPIYLGITNPFKETYPVFDIEEVVYTKGQIKELSSCDCHPFMISYNFKYIDKHGNIVLHNLLPSQEVINNNDYDILDAEFRSRYYTFNKTDVNKIRKFIREEGFVRNRAWIIVVIFFGWFIFGWIICLIIDICFNIYSKDFCGGCFFKPYCCGDCYYRGYGFNQDILKKVDKFLGKL